MDRISILDLIDRFVELNKEMKKQISSLEDTFIDETFILKSDYLNIGSLSGNTKYLITITPLKNSLKVFLDCFLPKSNTPFNTKEYTFSLFEDEIEELFKNDFNHLFILFILRNELKQIILLNKFDNTQHTELYLDF